MNCRGPAFLFGHKHPDDPRERVDITSGSFSLPATQTLKEHKPWPGKVQQLLAMLCLQPSICKTGKRSLRNPNIGIKAINNQP